MDIDYGAEAGRSYHTVQLSAKEVLAAGRRQHYCNVSRPFAPGCTSPSPSTNPPYPIPCR